jgi:hypothetical protein
VIQQDLEVLLESGVKGLKTSGSIKGVVVGAKTAVCFGIAGASTKPAAVTAVASRDSFSMTISTIYPGIKTLQCHAVTPLNAKHVCLI